MPKPDRIIHLRTILDRTGSSRSPLSRKIAEMTFPALFCALQGTGWRGSDIDRWDGISIPGRSPGNAATAVCVLAN
jgi:prophage regulatory protein